jgi:hypothetical protein
MRRSLTMMLVLMSVFAHARHMQPCCDSMVKVRLQLCCRLRAG